MKGGSEIAVLNQRIRPEILERRHVDSGAWARQDGTRGTLGLGAKERWFGTRGTLELGAKARSSCMGIVTLLPVNGEAS